MEQDFKDLKYIHDQLRENYDLIKDEKNDLKSKT